MGIQKRVVVLQILMYILFLFLAAFVLLRTFYDDNILLYGSLGIFVIALIIIYFIYKKGSTDLMKISNKQSTINRYNLYLYMFAYLAQVLFGNLNKGNDNKLVTIVFGSVLVISALFGIILHINIFIKNKKTK